MNYLKVTILAMLVASCGSSTEPVEETDATINEISRLSRQDDSLEALEKELYENSDIQKY